MLSDKKIKFLDLSKAYSELSFEIDVALLSSARSGLYLLGERLRRFEVEYAEFVRAAYCVGIGNGSDALRLALLGCGVREGDEVIVPSHTFIATWLAVTHIGAIPVPVEPDVGTMNINVELIDRAITKKTKAILVTHMYGLPVDLDPLLGLAKRLNLVTIEDAAQAHGSRYKSKRIGSHSDVVCWSFYPGKNLGAFGDAGAITTNSRVIADRIRSLRNYGSTEKYVYNQTGFNSRLDDIQAAVLSVKLKYLDEWNARRRGISDIYFKHLSHLPLIMPLRSEGFESAWHLFVVRTKYRNALRDFLAREGCESIIHYPIPPHKQKCYSKSFGDYVLPLAEGIADSVLSLPISPHHSDSEITRVCELCGEFFNQKGG